MTEFKKKDGLVTRNIEILSLCSNVTLSEVFPGTLFKVAPVIDFPFFLRDCSSLHTILPDNMLFMCLLIFLLSVSLTRM